jgi:cytochrome c
MLSLAMFAAGRPALAQDGAAGERVVKTQCATCHSPPQGKNGVGPCLFGLHGRPAGSVANVRYTAADKESGLTWDTATLDRYLQAPRQVVPGTAMSCPGLNNATQRADPIAFPQGLD